MAHITSNERMTSASSQGTGISQVVFVVVVLGIIAVGGWSLYMGNAPYHPEAAVSYTD